MRFSLYSEIQLHPGSSPEQLYAEVLEQMVNADRLGYDVYAVIEHFFFPKFSISANPTALFAAAAQRTDRINFRTMLHALPYHNPTVLAASIAVDATSSPAAATSSASAAGTAGSRPRPGVPLDEHARPRYEEAVDLLFAALGERALLAPRRVLRRRRLARRPVPAARRSASRSAAPSDRTYELAAEHGWSVAVPPLLPYVALEKQLDLYREKCAEHGTEPDIVWIHACHLDEDRDTAMREARDWMLGFITGNSSPLIEYEKPPDRGPDQGRLRLLHGRDHGAARRDPVRAARSRRTTSGSARPTT